MDLTKKPVGPCNLCKKNFKDLEAQYFITLGKKGGFLGSNSKTGIVCFGCYEKVDQFVQKIKKK